MSDALITPVSIPAALAQIHEQWQPHRLVSVNDHDVKIAKISGEFIWHAHPDSDELFVVNSIAGGIVSIIGLRQSKQLAGNGIFSNGRSISIAGILIGFIWGGICLLIIVGFIVFYFWILAVATNVQYPDSPVI